ncbi:MAG: hypothetical protein M0Z49_17040 [Chloroflexi bacterium]|nr:hypothetical protein [Chloroflexota bacterium]
MDHVEVARYWYDEPHKDCGLLRQGDVFENWLDDAHDLLVVVSQSCDLRKEPDAQVLVAVADLLETWLAENGRDIGQLDHIRQGKTYSICMLPRLPGTFESEVLVHLDALRTLGGQEVCEAERSGKALARAREPLSAEIGYRMAIRFNRPAIRIEIPTFDWASEGLTVASLDPAEFDPRPRRPIAIKAKAYRGRPASARAGEEWYLVWVVDCPELAATARSLDGARRLLVEQIWELLRAAALPPNLGTAVAALREAYF